MFSTPIGKSSSMFTNQNMFKKQEYVFAVTSNFLGYSVSKA